ncbi:MAG TPA: hypothetical protein VF774_19045 [Pseudoduganella sp.]|jgi:hypothetical protein
MEVVEVEGFANRFRELLAENIRKLLDYKIELMDREISEGWRVFHVIEVLLSEILPPPVINELGRQYEEESLRCKLWCKPGQHESSYTSSFLERFKAQPECRAGYRNFLHPGTLDPALGSLRHCYDRTVNDVIRERLVTHNSNIKFEIRALMEAWYIEAAGRGVLTSPLYLRDMDPQVPERTNGVPLAEDALYWKAVHQNRQRIVMNAEEFAAFTKPEWNLRLMAQMAPDFTYSPSLSTGKRLVFVQDGNSPLAWALMIDKTDGSTTYRYPPRLVLIDRMQKKKLKDEHIIFTNVIEQPFVGYTDGARCLETELLYFLPRSRRLIGFYAPFLGEAMSYASQRG